MTSASQRTRGSGAAILPNFLVIGAMKCGTTALHRYLDAHPDISMASWKEVNFFNGPDTAPDTDPDSWWLTGQWHRGLEWYASLFDGQAPVRGETSPGYTSPDHLEVVDRIGAVIPDVRLVYLVREPVARALSQYAHHHREGQERRPVAEALLDPGSQYVARSRYHERLQPFLERFDRNQILVVVQERLRDERREQLRRVYRHVGADPVWWDDGLRQRWHVGDSPSPLSPRLRAMVEERVADDVHRLRGLLGDEIAEWRR